MADSALLAAGGGDAPLSYVVPGATSILIKQVHVAYVDNGAAGDWLPAVRIVSDSNHTMGVAADQGVVVTAGDDAGVSFFPGVKHAAGFKSAFLNQSSLWQHKAAQSIPSGVLTPVTFATFTSAPGYSPPLFDTSALPSNPVTFTNFGRAAFTMVANFPAGAYDRYIELTIANPTIAQDSISPRVRSQVTPDGDRLTLTAVIAGGSSAPATTVTANVFQASGAPANVDCELAANGINGVIFLV